MEQSHQPSVLDKPKRSWLGHFSLISFILATLLVIGLMVDFSMSYLHVTKSAKVIASSQIHTSLVKELLRVGEDLVMSMKKHQEAFAGEKQTIPYELSLMRLQNSVDELLSIDPTFPLTKPLNAWIQLNRDCLEGLKGGDALASAMLKHYQIESDYASLHQQLSSKPHELLSVLEKDMEVLYDGNQVMAWEELIGHSCQISLIVALLIFLGAYLHKYSRRMSHNMQKLSEAWPEGHWSSLGGLKDLSASLQEFCDHQLAFKKKTTEKTAMLQKLILNIQHSTRTQLNNIATETENLLDRSCASQCKKSLVLISSSTGIAARCLEGVFPEAVDSSVTSVVGEAVITQPREVRHYGVTAIVAEDNYVNYKVLETMLKQMGIITLHANRGTEVMSLTDQEHSIILLDLAMPVMDGYEAARILRAANIQTPIIAITANEVETVREACSQVGINEVLAKPLFRQELIKVLDHWLDYQG